MKIEVVYALPDQQHSRWVELAAGATAGQALRASGYIDSFEDISADSPIGVFAKRVHLDDTLHDGDRLEIYRPLAMDPMQARRVRADRQKK